MTMDLTSEKLTEFEETIGYRFSNRELLVESLTHPSLNARRTDDSRDYQRLEFLGDAVIQLVVTRELFRSFPIDNEGALTRNRSALTRGEFLARLAGEIGLHNMLQMSDAEHASWGNLRTSALEDALEALVGAIHEDSGLEQASEVVLSWYGPINDRLEPLQKRQNPKGRLQEKVQPLHGNDALVYQVVRMDGDPHRRRFEVAVTLLDRTLGCGVGNSKKQAEEQAALEALDHLAREESK
ncbi:MAG: ribonuclease III [Verrucomicrobia bacterium]|nr:MAG: ribonuclease III [Verrucomicrobiota bacterium]